MILQGDCREVLGTLDAASIDACITDPPYEIGFMGRKWDASGVAYDSATWEAVLRVLKPGAYLLAFGGTRTHHRMVCAIEDAGFEIRDEIQWLYGSGFPKSLDVSKAIDKAAGAEREVVGRRNAGRASGGAAFDDDAYEWPGVVDVTAPATDAARQWDGWGTALKPACEPICVARKPLVGTVAANVLEHGTGALNIDGCRIEVQDDSYARNCSGDRGHAGTRAKEQRGATDYRTGGAAANQLGRWPANVILDPEAAAVLNEQSGKLTGGASRFFYVAKPSKKERGEFNTHPTVKPLALLRYLCRLVVPPGGTVLDPFAGSGSLLLAAQEEGFRAIGIELVAEHIAIAERRLAQRNLFAQEARMT